METEKSQSGNPKSFGLIHGTVTLTQAHPLDVTAPGPLGRVLDHSGSNHVELDIHHAFPQMPAFFNHRAVISVCPKGARPVFVPIIGRRLALGMGFVYQRLALLAAQEWGCKVVAKHPSKPLQLRNQQPLNRLLRSAPPPPPRGPASLLFAAFDEFELLESVYAPRPMECPNRNA